MYQNAETFKIEELEERLEMTSAELLADNGICWNQEQKEEETPAPAAQ